MHNAIPRLTKQNVCYRVHCCESDGSGNESRRENGGYRPDFILVTLTWIQTAVDQRQRSLIRHINHCVAKDDYSSFLAFWVRRNILTNQVYY